MKSPPTEVSRVRPEAGVTSRVRHSQTRQRGAVGHGPAPLFRWRL